MTLSLINALYGTTFWRHFATFVLRHYVKLYFHDVALGQNVYVRLATFDVWHVITNCYIITHVPWHWTTSKLTHERA